MLRLTLIRHGNAEWKDANYADFDRPLNKRGIAEVEGITKVLLENELVPDLMLSSTAKRTQETAEILGRVMELPVRRAKFAEQLYLARAEVMLTLVQSTGPKVKHLAVVGHNPGISELARELAPAGTPVAELSTGSACTLTFVLDAWAELTAPASRVVRYDPPAKLFT